MDERTGTRRQRPSILPRGLSRLEAAAYVGLSPNAFDRAVRAGDLPAPRRFPSVAKALWDRVQLDRVFDRSSPGQLSCSCDDEEAMLRAIDDPARESSRRAANGQRRRARRPSRGLERPGHNQ